MPKRFAEAFDPPAVAAMMMAFDKACDALGLPRRHDALTEELAKTIVAQARTGELNPDKLCALALAALRR